MMPYRADAAGSVTDTKGSRRDGERMGIDSAGTPASCGTPASRRGLASAAAHVLG